MSSVSDIARKLNRSWKEEVLSSGNFTKELKRLSMGDLGFDYPLFGGLPYGQLIVYSGTEHSGKTTAACLAMARYQQENPDKICIYVDAENTLLTQAEHLQRMTGISFEPEHFLRYDMTGKAAEEMFADILELEEADDIGMIIIDSAPALISKADIDSEFLKDNGLRANISKNLGRFIRHMIMYLPKRNNILLIINQVRVDGVSFTGAKLFSEPCGYSLNYYPSMKVRFGTRTYTLGDKTDLSSSKGEGADGFRLKFSITKSRLGPVNRGGGFLTFRLDSGLDVCHDMLEVAMKFGYIEHPNNITYILNNLETGEYYLDEEGNPLKFAGKTKLIAYLNEHPDFRDEYFSMLGRYVSESQSKVDLLDKDTMKEILDQEAQLSHEKTSDDEDDDIEVDSETGEVINEE